VIKGAVAPKALPNEVPATAVVAAISSNDLLEMGDLAQDFNKYAEWLFIREP
jgi:hypothetical protein